jgi:hypothetical protein
MDVKSTIQKTIEFIHKQYNADLKIVVVDGVHQHQLDNLLQEKSYLMTSCVLQYQDTYDHVITQINPSFHGIWHMPFDVDNLVTVTKKYNCFINRLDVLRQSWFYHLCKNQWLDLGYVSCLSSSRNFVDIAAKKTPREIFEREFQNSNKDFVSEHDAVKNLIPFQNFEDTQDLVPYILQSSFSIVLETWVYDNNCTTFSEKTFRCLQLPRPWILFSTKGAVQQLRTWGFDVLDDIVDHGYDHCNDTGSRQLAMIETARTMFDIDISKIQKRCLDASLHNQALLRNWCDRWKQDFEADLESAIVKIKKLPKKNPIRKNP